MSDLLSRIVSALQARKRTWRTLAERYGVPYITLGRIARGETTNPTLETLNKLEPITRLRKPKQNSGEQ